MSLENVKELDRGRVNVCRKDSFSKSVIRQLVKFRYSKLSSGVEYLNLGCGSNLYDSFINADIFVSKSMIFRKNSNYWYLNAASKWKCPDNYFLGIYTEHMLEHLTYSDAIKALKECYRTLKNNGDIRIVIPSLDNYLSFKNEKEKNFFKNKFHFKALAISNLTQNAGHISTWDFELLKHVMEEIGFRDVVQVQYNEGKKSRLLKDSLQRKWASIYVEARK